MSGTFDDTLTLSRADAFTLPTGDGTGRTGSWQPGTGGGPSQHRRWATEFKLLVAAGVVTSCLVTSAFMTFYAMQDYARTTAMVQRTVEVLALLQTADGKLDDSQVAVMTYVLDVHPAHLVERDQLNAGSKRAIATLIELMKDRAQQRQLSLLEETFAAHVALQDRIIAARQTSGHEAAANELLGDHANAASAASVARIIDGMIARESELFGEQQAAEQSKRRTVSLTAGAGLSMFLGAAVLLFVHIWRDLHIRARLGRERDASRRFLESIITVIPHPILIKEVPSLSYTLVNPAMAALIGLPLEDTLEKNDFSFFPKERAQRTAALDRKALAQGKLMTEVVSVPTAQRGERTFRTTRLPFHDETGQKSYLLTIAEDISDMLAGQNKLRDLNGVLQQQTEELRAAVSELSSFSYTVSHDLRTPLRAMDGFAGMLQEDYGERLDDTGRRYISIIRDSSQRMGALIDALLSYTRIGREAPTIVPVDMGQLVIAARDAASSAYPAVSAMWDIGPLPGAAGDRALLKQVWINLLHNAVKFSQKVGEPRIEIRGVNQGHEIVYSVRDNGVGFDMQFSSKLFGLFQRLHTDDPYCGAGVGLAVVKRIVAHHGGRAWAESAAGGGATFFFSLPRECGDDVA